MLDMGSRFALHAISEATAVSSSGHHNLRKMQINWSENRAEP